jgi:hypothetical protein
MAAVQKVIQWRLIYKLIVDWLEASTGLERSHIIKGRQNANHPVYPAATFTLLNGPTMIGQDDARVVTTTGTGAAERAITRYQGPRKFTLSIMIEVGPDGDDNSDPDCDAVALMSAALAYLHTDAARDPFNSFGLALVRANPVIDLSEVLNGEFVSRAAMDVDFATNSVFESDPEQFVDNLTATATYSQPGLPDIVEPFSTS